jgi:DNA-binding response OmpR family regulator
MAGKKRYRVLMIDDDIELGELLAEYFERFGHRLTLAATAAAGRQRLRGDDPDLLILDVMLPDADGMELCRELRTEHRLPILMLTARGDLPDRVLGLEFGADDYVPKPFEPRELVARVEAMLRRSRAPQATASCGRLTSQGLALDPETRAVTLDGSVIDLTTAEYELLRLLMASRGRVLTREAILHDLRGLDADVFDRSVDMLVSRLRKKLADDSRSPRFVKTLRGIGYQFVGGRDD